MRGAAGGRLPPFTAFFGQEEALPARLRSKDERLTVAPWLGDVLISRFSEQDIVCPLKPGPNAEVAILVVGDALEALEVIPPGDVALTNLQCSPTGEESGTDTDHAALASVAGKHITQWIEHGEFGIPDVPRSIFDPPNFDPPNNGGDGNSVAAPVSSEGKRCGMR